MHSDAAAPPSEKVPGPQGLCAMAPAGDQCPGSTGRHRVAPEIFSAYVPAVHMTHDADDVPPVLAAWPATHGVQVVFPAADHVPAGHGSQPVAPDRLFAIVPAGHCWQLAADVPGVAVKRPAPHGVH